MQNPEKIKNPWTTLSGEEKYDNKWITVTEYQVINPGGGEGIYGKVHFKNRAIGVIPLDKDLNTWLVGQFRYTLNEWHWEIPEGGGPLDQTPLEAAQRELLEETGLKARRWKQIIRLHTSNSVTDEEGFVFLAEDIEAGESNLEETEADLKVWKLPFKDALQMVLNGKITDSMSVMGMLMVARMKGL
ncbi:NUDIX domain-containing protein [Chryseosolibacter indicus]|uniref:GDP-mannose pyrophosphatase n=1 Tax=Chryseosolibacter indicus TaxID=2782351 RepID=A0ABS5VM08_9BACT|nr:NUDIX hydrolase [Chryseosolibacter indicus]MBT1702146.1 NUDIX hydrolase [Chryseosolibacter indicus]